VVLARRPYGQAMVSYRPNDHPKPRPGVRMTVTERQQLRRARRGRDAIIRALLGRGLPAWQIAEVVR